MQFATLFAGEWKAAGEDYVFGVDETIWFTQNLDDTRLERLMLERIAPAYARRDRTADAIAVCDRLLELAPEHGGAAGWRKAREGLGGR